MVVGEAGLGKTTLLESFFKSFKDDEAAFALFERKETATEIETRRQLAEAQVRRNAAERELQAAIEKANYTVCHAKQAEIEQLTETMAGLSDRLRELSLSDERRRNELRALREATRGLRLEMKRNADQGAFVAAAEFQLEANLLQVECDAVQSELKQVRRGLSDGKRGKDAYPISAGEMAGALSDEDDEDDEERVPGQPRGLSSATVTVKAFDPFCISVGKHELQVTLVDTPGYGESLHTEESFEVICKYVDALFEKQLRAESSWSPRDAERLRLHDPLVHCCLYFIAPHRLKHIDIAFMRALHRKVNIVPIIAKSDTMTTKEKEEFKLQVREALQHEGIDAFAFDTSVLRAMEQQDKQEYKLPWAVIGSTDAYMDAGATVYLRKYPWGDALSSEPAHSDLPALRNLLMWSGQWHDLKMATRAKYEAWRVSRPLSRRSSAAIATGCRAVAARLRKVSERGCRARRACVRSFETGCEAVGVPARYGVRAMLVLLLALGGAAAPPAFRWATGRDLSLSRQLELAKLQVDGLVLDKARLVERYERELAEVRSRLHVAQSSGELYASTERTHTAERAELKRELRQAVLRADVAEAALKQREGECTLWAPLASAGAKASAKVGGIVSGATEHVVAASRNIGKETAEGFSQLAKEAPNYLSSASRKGAEAARRLFSEQKPSVG